MTQTVHNNFFNSSTLLIKEGGMAARRFLLAGALLLTGSFALLAQTLPPGQAAKFGIDGDTKSDQAAQGGFTAAGSHDWFKKPGGSGNGLFDTAGYSVFGPQLAGGENISFVKPMQYSRYSVQDGILMLDALYTRDHMGGVGDGDKTTFQGVSNKNWQSPANWGTNPNGSSVTSKSDIIDAFVNMRRNGTVISGNNPSDLVLTLAGTTLATDGDHYLDFDLFRERVNYNAVTGAFTGTAPASTGGRSPWSFEPSGKISQFGDLTISFSYNSSQVKEISVYLWVSYTDYKNNRVDNFSFLDGSWSGGASRSGYGFAKILPNGNYGMNAWGTVNLVTTDGPMWGTSSKDLGNQGGNYFSNSYAAGQFAEAGINLTAFGIDPARSQQGMSGCNPPFTRFMVKSRSSSSFDASLQDFIGPFEFLDAPMAPAKIVPPANLTCTRATVNLEPVDYLKGAHYSWSTTNGRIIFSNPDSSIIKVDKAGVYYLRAALVEGCTVNQDSTIVLEDSFKPKATASASSTLVYGTAPVTLYGGNFDASNYQTPFGGSRGLTYSWSGPLGFTSMQQNPMTNMAGTYTITVKETRNGCTDVASVALGAGIVLPVKFTDFYVNADQQKAVNKLTWKIANPKDADQFIAEKSTNGKEFRAISYLMSDDSRSAFTVADRTTENLNYYRIKAVDKSGAVTYSQIRITRLITEGSQIKMAAYPNPATDQVYVTLPAAWQGKAVHTEVVNATGVVVHQSEIAFASQTEELKVGGLAKGVYFVRAVCGNESAQQRIVKN